MTHNRVMLAALLAWTAGLAVALAAVHAGHVVAAVALAAASPLTLAVGVRYARRYLEDDR